jgi:hypothetical protein
VTTESADLQFALGSLARELEKADRRRPARNIQSVHKARSTETRPPEA